MSTHNLSKSFPWTARPLIISAPMYRIALSRLAVAVTLSGGLGFLAAGLEVSSLDSELSKAADMLAKSSVSGGDVTARDDGTLPIGVGFLNWGADLKEALRVLEKWRVSAVWLYAPYRMEDLKEWSDGVRKVSGGKTQVWVQVGSVELAVKAMEVCRADVIVVQGSDAGGHGLVQGAGIVTLLPEVVDLFEERGWKDVPIVAAGGIMDGRGVAACLTLGADAVVMGTRFLVAEESEVKDGYRKEVIRASDGGVNTVRSSVYDHARGIHGWPEEYNGRGVINRSFKDSVNGMDKKEIERLYEEELEKGDVGWGPDGRLCTYAGTGLGLVKKTATADEIVQEVIRDTIACLDRTARAYGQK